jgi:hypothetical protein
VRSTRKGKPTHTRKPCRANRAYTRTRAHSPSATYTKSFQEVCRPLDMTLRTTRYNRLRAGAQVHTWTHTDLTHSHSRSYSHSHTHIRRLLNVPTHAKVPQNPQRCASTGTVCINRDGVHQQGRCASTGTVCINRDGVHQPGRCASTGTVCINRDGVHQPGRCASTGTSVRCRVHTASALHRAWSSRGEQLRHANTRT